MRLRRARAWAAGLALLLLGAAIIGGDRLLTRGITYGVDFPSAVSTPPAPYGVDVELDKIVDDADLNRSLALISEAGFTYIRQVFGWNEIEISAKGDFYDHKNGKSAWDKFDRLVNAANAAGLQVIARLERPPDWSRADNQYATRPPDNFQDYGDFVSAFVTHYKGRIHYIQIWNEPNRYEDWGYQPVDPAAYTRLLQVAYRAAKAADPSVTVLSAALTPTTDCCMKNRPDPVYLQQMYDAGARGYFDILGAQAYGLRAGPEDAFSDLPWHPLAAKRAVIAPQNTNFGRVVLDREVMVRNGDAAKPVWVGEFGWNALPAGWNGDPSPWGSVTLDQQARYTVQAYQRARQEWPWLGVMAVWLFQDPSPAGKDPTQFFGLVDARYQPRPVFDALTQYFHLPARATTGAQTPADPAVSRSGPWQADGANAISPVAGAQMKLRFEGQAVSLRVMRGPAMGIAYLTVDGSATYATDISKDSAGRAALDLYAVRPGADAVQVASGLPNGEHVLTVTVSGLHAPQSTGAGVEISGFAVGLTRDPRPTFFGGLLAGLGALIVGWKAALWSRRRWAPVRSLGPSTAAVHESSGTAQRCLAAARAYAPWLMAASLALFYFPHQTALSALGAITFLVLAAVRTDAALPFVALAAPFYLQPKHLGGLELPLSEVVIGLALAGLILNRFTAGGWVWRSSAFVWPALLFLAASTASVLAADYPRYALREYRTDVLEPLAFFFLLLQVRPKPKVMLDALLAGGAIVAIVALAQYAAGHSIQAEGVRRLVGVYQSPDNLALYLGRLVPIAGALCLLGPWPRPQRIAYGAVGSLMLGCVVLSFTRGAWLGVFVSLLLVAAFAGRGLLLLGLAGGAASAVGASFVQARRLRSVFDFTPGSTGFTRLALWRSTARMIEAHPWFGIGLDNFLYQYPRYMLPEAANEPDLSHPHNLVLDFWSRVGVFGLASLVWLEALFFTKAARLSRHGGAAGRSIAVAMMASMVDALVHGLVDNSYFLIDLALVFWLTLGLIQLVEWGSPEAEEASP